LKSGKLSSVALEREAVHEMHVLLEVSLAAADVRAQFALGEAAVEVKVQKTPRARLELLVALAAHVNVSFLDGHVVLAHLVVCGEVGRRQHFGVQVHERVCNHQSKVFHFISPI
jgi:prepilin-type processing-associated H-X9-DG protein